jgi:hypothetical protein
MRLYTPFLKLKDVKRFQAKYANWPPKSASPAIAIEPWGKNFFWLNASKTAEFTDHPDAPPWDSMRPPWLRDEVRLGLLLPSENPNAFIPSTHGYMDDPPVSLAQNIPYLVITDFRKRPLAWLTLEDVEALAGRLYAFGASFDEFDKLANDINLSVASDDAAKRQLVEAGDKFRTYRRGRWMKPRHDYGCRGARSGRLRLKRRT